MELVDAAPLKELEAEYEIKNDILEFYFQKDNSITYRHKFSNIRSYLTHSL
ncbi:15983_t:CDS:1, partial [Racocetra persica]